jgi:molybdenum cofactor cytidylyltransferase
MTSETLPVVEPPSVESGGESTVHGIVLAAGTSSRYGSKNKLLQPIDGEPVIRRSVTPFVVSHLSAVTVVLGHDRERVRAALRGLEIEFRYNDSYEAGQSTSVREGTTAARETNADAVVFGLGDMPFVSPATINTLIDVYRVEHRSAIAAGYRGKRGNPVLFDSQHFETLGSVSGDVGGRDILRNDPNAVVVETDDFGVLRDIDQPADLPQEGHDSGRFR